MKALVVFGSKSDHYIYEPLVAELEKNKVEVELKTISAHRNLPTLQTTLKESNYDFVVAGAGLAAHLPGVVAAQIGLAEPELGREDLKQSRSCWCR